MQNKTYWSQKFPIFITKSAGDSSPTLPSFVNSLTLSFVTSLPTWVLRVVLVAADLPVPRFHGLLAAGEVLLGKEGLLVGCDLAEILGTVADGFRDCGEADASEEFTFGRNGASLHFLAEIQAVTVFRLGCCGTVGTEEHFGARVLTVLARFAECAGDMIDTGTPFYFCHIGSALFILAPYEFVKVSDNQKRQQLTGS